MKSLNILIVDDIESNIFALRLMIEDYFDLNIYEALGASEALEILLSHKIDLIISDVQMPLIDGFEFARYLKSIETLKHIPIILNSGIYCSDEIEDKIKELDIHKFLTKPIDYEELSSAINEFVCYENYLQISNN